MIRYAIATLALISATAAQAGTDSYEFIKECSFTSRTLGDFKVALYKNPNPYERDRAVIIKSSAYAPAPTLFDDVPKEFETEACGTSLKKSVISYGKGPLTTVKFYENADPNYFGWGRLKVFYRTSGGSNCGVEQNQQQQNPYNQNNQFSQNQQHQHGCGNGYEYPQEVFEILETNNCVSLSSF